MPVTSTCAPCCGPTGSNFVCACNASGFCGGTLLGPHCGDNTVLGNTLHFTFLSYPGLADCCLVGQVVPLTWTTPAADDPCLLAAPNPGLAPVGKWQYLGPIAAPCLVPDGFWLATPQVLNCGGVGWACNFVKIGGARWRLELVLRPSLCVLNCSPPVGNYFCYGFRGQLEVLVPNNPGPGQGIQTASWIPYWVIAPNIFFPINNPCGSFVGGSMGDCSPLSFSVQGFLSLTIQNPFAAGGGDFASRNPSLYNCCPPQDVCIQERAVMCPTIAALTGENVDGCFPGQGLPIQGMITL